jgi:hypothetical protein
MPKKELDLLAAFGLDYLSAAKDVSPSLSHLNGGPLFVALLHTAEPGSIILTIHVVDVHALRAVPQTSKSDIAGVMSAERSCPNHDVNRFGDDRVRPVSPDVDAFPVNLDCVPNILESGHQQPLIFHDG